MATVVQSKTAQAYIEEYGHAPKDRDEQDRYSAFRFGFEAGYRYGRSTERNELRRYLGEEH